MKVMLSFGFTVFVVIIVCYSAIVAKFARTRCHTQVGHSSNSTAQHNHRREIRLALQFAMISILFFCAMMLENFQTAVPEVQLLVYAVVVLVCGIDIPLLCVCNPGLRADILKTLRCKETSGEYHA